MLRIKQIVTSRWLPAHQGKAPYIWLLMLIFFVLKYLFNSYETKELYFAILTVIVFLPLYLLNYWLTDRGNLLCILAVSLLGILWSNHNPGAITFFIFAAGMCACIQQKHLAYGALSLVLLVVGGVTLIWHLPLDFALTGYVVGIPVGVASILYAEVHRSQDKLLRTQEEVRHMATIAERERISRDLHDLLGHTLSLITLKAELAGKLFERDKDACQREIKDIENSARTALAEVRAAVSGYRQIGFSHELNHASQCLATASIELITQVQAVNLNAANENVLALALREAVTNVVRHAGATRCEIRLALESGLIVLQIRDNGNRVSDIKAIQQGNGLVGMRERVKALGGALVLKAENGMSIELSLPVGANL